MVWGVTESGWDWVDPIRIDGARLIETSDGDDGCLIETRDGTRMMVQSIDLDFS